MARSTYIYVVFEQNYDDTEFVAAFTVKRELVGWLRNHRDPGRFYVERLRDGVAVVSSHCRNASDYLEGGVK